MLHHAHWHAALGRIFCEACVSELLGRCALIPKGDKMEGIEDRGGGKDTPVVDNVSHVSSWAVAVFIG